MEIEWNMWKVEPTKHTESRCTKARAQRLRAGSPAANSALNKVVKIEQNATLIDQKPTQMLRKTDVNAT
jgi:hypothetical protein